MTDFWKNEFLSGRSIILAIIIYVIAVVIMNILNYKKIKLETCFCQVENSMWSHYVNMFRGRNYYLMAFDPECRENDRKRLTKIADSCVVTIWAFLHMGLYAILGFISPRLFWPLFMVGIVYELFEYLHEDYHCVMDLGWNLAGLTIGYYLRKALLPWE